MINQPRIITVRTANQQFPRHSESAIIARKDGSVMMVWQEYLANPRGGGDAGPSQISMLSSHDDGHTWSDYRVLIQRSPNAVNLYSPSLLRLPDDQILLTYFEYMVLEQGKSMRATHYARRSADEGQTWSDAKVILAESPSACCNATARIIDGQRIIIPMQQVIGETWTPSEKIISTFLISDDLGETWRTAPGTLKLPMRGVMETHIEQLRDHRLIAVMRSQLGSVFKAYSYDRGEHWSLPQTTGLMSPESCPEIVRIPSTGHLLLVWNHSPYNPSHASHFGKRTPLTVAVSTDEGDTWINIRNIETDPTRAFTNPTTFFTARGKCILTYWTCPYHASGAMNVELLDLKAALFDVDWLYSSNRIA